MSDRTEILLFVMVGRTLALCLRMATRVGSAERLRFGGEIRGRDAPGRGQDETWWEEEGAGVFLEGLGPEKRRTGREGTPRLSSREGLDSAALAARISESAVVRFRSVTASRPISSPSNGAQRRPECCARRARALVCPCALRRACTPGETSSELDRGRWGRWLAVGWRVPSAWTGTSLSYIGNVHIRPCPFPELRVVPSARRLIPAESPLSRSLAPSCTLS